MQTSDKPIIIQQDFPCSSDRLWSAITEPKEMRQWFFDNIPDFKTEIGFTTSFDISSPERKFPHVWEVMEVIPQKLIAVKWTFTGYEGASKVTMAIEPRGEESTITLTALALENYPTDIPEFKRESGVGGWKYFIQGNLKSYIDSNP